MHITYEDVKAGIEEIIAEKGEDYVYVSDPKAIEAAIANAKALRENSANPDSPVWVGMTGIGENAKGETIALNCTYRNLDGTPGCLVGHYVDKIAPGFVMEDAGWGRDLIKDTGITMDDKASDFLAELQSQQDMGRTWGNSLSYALLEYEVSE